MQIRLDSGTTLNGFSAICKRSLLKCLQSNTENPSQTSRSEQPAGGIPKLLKRHSTSNFNTIRVFARKFHLFTMRLRCKARRVTTSNSPLVTVSYFSIPFSLFPICSSTSALNPLSMLVIKTEIRKTHAAKLISKS